DPASGFREAKDDQAHEQRADQVGHRSRGAERRGSRGRETEDAPANREVDDVCRETPDADGAEKRSFPRIAIHVTQFTGGELTSSDSMREAADRQRLQL